MSKDPPKASVRRLVNGDRKLAFSEIEAGNYVDALQSGQIAGAGFDVLTQEPLPAAHPFHAILSHPAFILTPHVAWASDEAMQALADQLVDNVAAFARGEPRHVVTAG